VREARHWLIAERLLIPVIILVAGSAGILWFALRGGLSALSDLSEGLARRSAQDLAPLDPAAWPADLGGLVGALNRLLGRIGEAFEHEQSFTDKAAHQLRTPLAALRLQAQLVLRDMPEDKRAPVRELIAGVDHASNTIKDMLALARLDATALSMKSVDLAVVARDALAERAGVAAAAGVAVAFLGEDACRVTTDATPIAVALAALIENAIVHGGAGGTIEVAVRRVRREVVLTVSDGGPGMSAERRAGLERVVTDRTGDHSTGLGLEIVRRAMTVIGGRARFDAASDGRGLSVSLIVPA
jgi:signal transduction histidine kinase